MVTRREILLLLDTGLFMEVDDLDAIDTGIALQQSI
jgi:hypothetical protein